MTRLQQEVSVKIQDRDVKIQAWHYNCKSLTGGCVPIIFLDTNVEGNSWDDRRITDFLYGGDHTYRLKQEIVLGIGGVRMLEALGFKVRKYHMNEGHSSLLALELLKRNGKDPAKVKELCIFTTHTPVEAGHDKFDYGLLKTRLGIKMMWISLEDLEGQTVLTQAFLPSTCPSMSMELQKGTVESQENSFQDIQSRQ